MSNNPPDNTVEQRRKVLKGALAASGVVTMGYSGSALASFECVTSTDATGVFGFKKTIGASANWAWLRLLVFDTNKSNNDQGNWKAVKIPTGSDPTDADTDTDTLTYFFQDSAAIGNSPPLYAAGDTALPEGIQAQGTGTGFTPLSSSISIPGGRSSVSSPRTCKCRAATTPPRAPASPPSIRIWIRPISATGAELG